MLIFATTCHPTYRRAWIFQSLSRLTCRTAALLDPDDGRELPHNVQRIAFRSDRFYQDGRFIDAMRVRDDDTVVLADADGIVQRDFSGEERLLLHEGLTAGAVAVGYNMRPGQTGEQELDILRLAKPLDDAASALRMSKETLLGCRMYNWGLVAAKTFAWNRLRTLYAQHTAGIDPQSLFVNPTWMQYVLCCILHRHSIPVLELGYETHSHGHFAPTDDHCVWDGRYFYRGKPVFFAHFVQGVTH